MILDNHIKEDSERGWCFLNDFTFGINAEKFETALQEIGSLLGFISQRPDKEIRKEPDNLWGGYHVYL